MNRRSFSALAALAAIAALTVTACSPSGSDTESGSASETYSVGITQITSHPALDAARDGFKAALSDAGISVTYDEQNAQGDQATALSIASKFSSSQHDLILAIATPSAQSVIQGIRDTPVLFTAVTDPVSAQLVKSAEAPGGNVTGTTDMNPIAEQLELVTSLVPEAKTVGIVYSAGEVNSEVQVDIVKEKAKELGLEIKEATVTNSSEVAQAARTLSDVDAFYVPTDNTVVSSLSVLLQVAHEEKIPVIAAETNSVRNGAIATYGIDYEKLGRQTGEMAIRILTQGADPATMPVEAQSEYALIINRTAAEKMGVTIPQTLLDTADEVVE